MAVAGAAMMAAETVRGQAGALQAPRMIPSLLEPGQGLGVRDVSWATGFVSFAATRGRGLLLPLAADAAADERALAFVDAYGAAFGLRDRSQARMLRAAPVADELGIEHVRLQQIHQGVPVRGGELIVHLRGPRVIAVNGLVLDRLPGHVVPAYPSGAAEIEARALVDKVRPRLTVGARVSAPRLEIFSHRVFGRGDLAPRLAWFFEATGPALREQIWIDATSGGVLLNFSQLGHASSRQVYNANSTNVLPGSLARVEEQPATGVADVDHVYDLTGATYDYFFGQHGRDSFDGRGGTLISTVNYCPAGGSCPYGNAFWNGVQTVYGAGFASSDDVVAHELTHAVTEHTADLFFYYQSGALNESYSDIFGEIVDLTSTTSGGNDTPAARWRIGEDLPVGAIRDMMTPVLYGDPGKVSDAEFACVTDAWTNPSSDLGGVHTNSGVPNHAFALMVDGGVYNRESITGIGLSKAGKIQYRALSTYLVSGSTFHDNYLAVNQACADLVGQHGITGADCTEVDRALRAVEMPATWNCPGATAPPAQMCANGPVVATTFADDMEADAGNWTSSSTSTTQWSYFISTFSTSGIRSLFGAGPASSSDHRIALATPVFAPQHGKLYFRHAFEFDSSAGTNWDGGVIEYSTDMGGSWIDAGGLIDGGQTYSGTLSPDNPLGPRPAFTRSSYGFTATRLDLSPVAGQELLFRYRIGTDSTVGALGWIVDDVSVYVCSTGTAPQFTQHPQSQIVGPGDDVQFTVTVQGSPAPAIRWEVLPDGGTTWSSLSDSTLYSGSGTPTLTITDAPLSLNGVRYRAVATNAAGSGASTPALLQVTANPPTVARPFDFDGDGRTDLSIFRPGNAQWWVQRSSTSAYFAVAFGTGTDAIAPGDYTGDGRVDIASFRPGTGLWSVLRSEDNSSYGVAFGASGDVPVPADYDGDGRADVAVFRPSSGSWFIRRSSDGGTTVQGFGASTDVPVPGDYDGDGRADIAIFRPGVGEWWILQSTLGLRLAHFGMDGDRAVPGDYTGDGRTDIAVWRPSTGTWFVMRSEDASYYAFAFGTAGDVPVPGDYDGDGRIDTAVFRPAGGTWYIQRSTGGTAILSFGLGTDTPVPSAFVRMN